MDNLYKEWYDCATEEEQSIRWKELKDKGYDGSDIYTANFWGNDGKFHREVFVFNR